jgi:hypothetical protein
MVERCPVTVLGSPGDTEVDAYLILPASHQQEAAL